MLKSLKGQIRGTVRLKKFGADQDITKDKPQEVLERIFSLDENQMKEMQKGNAFAKVVGHKVEIENKNNKRRN